MPDAFLCGCQGYEFDSGVGMGFVLYVCSLSQEYNLDN